MTARAWRLPSALWASSTRPWCANWRTVGWRLIAGERRKYSAIKAGLATIPVFVRDDLSPVHQLAGMLVENHDREGLTPTEEAVAIQQLAGFEGVTQRDITTMTGIKAGDVRTALRWRPAKWRPP